MIGAHKRGREALNRAYRFREAGRDAVLVGIATLAIVVTFWPAAANRQIVSYAPSAESTARSVSFPIDDPQISRIVRRIETWGPPEPIAAYGLVRWRLESAEHYARDNRRRAEQRAGGDSQESTVGAETDWETRARRAEQSLEALAREQERRRRAYLMPPFALGGVVKPGPPAMAFVWGLSAGSVAALVALAWGALAPPRKWGGPISKPRRRSADADASLEGGVAVAVPEHWVHLRQPAPVWARRGCFTALVVLALIGAVRLAL